MPVIRCKGIASIITSDESTLEDRDNWHSDDSRFNEVPMSLAENYARMKKTVPLFLLHNKRFRVGTVHSFHIEKRVLRNKLENVLVTDFSITNKNFIRAIQKCTNMRFDEVKPTPYVSSDGFIKLPKNKQNNAKAPDLDVTAHVALLQRFPELSLGHNVKTLNVTEMSMCLAGARDMTVLTSAVYKPEIDEDDDDDDDDDHFADKDSVDDYINVFASLLSTSNGPLNDKAADDLLNVPNLPVSSVLRYSKDCANGKPNVLVPHKAEVRVAHKPEVREEDDTNTGIDHSQAEATIEEDSTPMYQPNQSFFDTNFTHSVSNQRNGQATPSTRTGKKVGASELTKSLAMDTSNNATSQQQGLPSSDFLEGFYQHAMVASRSDTNTPQPQSMHFQTLPQSMPRQQRQYHPQEQQPLQTSFQQGPTFKRKRNDDSILMEIKRLRESVEGGMRQVHPQPPFGIPQPIAGESVTPSSNDEMKDIVTEMKRLSETVAVFSREREQTRLQVEEEKLTQQTKLKEEKEQASLKAMFAELLASHKDQIGAAEKEIEMDVSPPALPPAVQPLPLPTTQQTQRGETESSASGAKPQEQEITGVDASASQVHSDSVSTPPPETSFNFAKKNNQLDPAQSGGKKTASVLQLLRSNMCTDSYLFNRKAMRQTQNQRKAN